MLDDRPASTPGARELFDQLNRGSSPAFLGPGDYHWFVHGDRTALLGLAATARTVALTSRRHARQLIPRLGLRAAPDHVVLVSQLPAELIGLLDDRRRGAGQLRLVRAVGHGGARMTLRG